MSTASYCYPYPRPMVTVDVLIFSLDKSQVLLIQRKHEPFKDAWAIPGGFIDMDETAEHAAARELQEETGLEGIEMQQFKTYTAVDRDPRGRTITILFVAKINPAAAKVSAGDDAKAAQWWPSDALPSLAFDHAHILEEVLQTKDF